MTWPWSVDISFSQPNPSKTYVVYLSSQLCECAPNQKEILNNLQFKDTVYSNIVLEFAHCTVGRFFNYKLSFVSNNQKGFEKVKSSLD